MKLRFKYEIRDVNFIQYCFLKQCFGNTRFVYNHFLTETEQRRETDKNYFFDYNTVAKELTTLKKQEEFNWLKNTPNEILQQSLRHLDTAFKNMKKTGASFPKKKSKYNYDYTASFTHAEIDFNTWELKLPKCKTVFKLAQNYRHSKLSFSDLKQGTITVEMTPDGRFWCSVVLTVSDDFLANSTNLKFIYEDEILAGDLGLKDFLSLSDGRKIDNFNKTIKKIKYLEETIKHMQKAYERKQKGSKRKEKFRKKIAKYHAKIKNIRLNMLIQIATELANDNRYKIYVFEDLNIQGMMQNHHLAHAIQSIGWSTFLDIMRWQAKKRGKYVFNISRWFPSSKTCTHCGYINKDLELKDRFWICPECGEIIDRDLNAAINIKKEFIKNHLQQEILNQEENKTVVVSSSEIERNIPVDVPVKRTLTEEVTNRLKCQISVGTNSGWGK